MRKKENRRFANDSWEVAIARNIFVKWMKSRGLWSGYMNHFAEYPYFKKEAWEHPQKIEDFLGSCAYDYDYAYVPWTNYCSILIDNIRAEQNGYTKNNEEC